MEAVRTENGLLFNACVCPALCLDLDGTIRYSKSGTFINGADDIALFDGVEEKIWKYRDNGYLIFGISNQGGVAYGFKTFLQVEEEMDATELLFNRNPFHAIQQCYHHEEGKVFPYNYRSMFRKPNTGMLAMMEVEAFKEGYVVDWNNSLFVGDRPEDEQCAANAGIPFQWAYNFFNRESLP